MASHKSVDEFSVELLELAGLGSAMKTLHLPFGKESHKMLYEFEEHTSVYSEDTDTPADLHRVFSFRMQRNLLRFRLRTPLMKVLKALR